MIINNEPKLCQYQVHDTSLYLIFFIETFTWNDYLSRPVDVAPPAVGVLDLN